MLLITCLELIVRLLWSLLMFAYPLAFWCNVVQQQYCTLRVANMCVYALGRLASTADADASISFCIYQGNISLRCTRPFVRFLIVMGIYGAQKRKIQINKFVFVSTEEIKILTIAFEQVAVLRCTHDTFVALFRNVWFQFLSLWFPL